MAKQFILCFESDRRAQTDWLYVNEAIKNFLCPDRTVTFNQIYMGGKGRFSSPKINKMIQRFQEGNTGPTYVLIFTDTDSFEKDQGHKIELDNVIQYCRERGYHYVWFCHDVEEVFLGKRINNAEKTEEAQKFVREKKILSMDRNRLFQQDMRAGASNALYIIDWLMKG